jgi:hypothetical protein
VDIFDSAESIYKKSRVALLVEYSSSSLAASFGTVTGINNIYCTVKDTTEYY